ncbi:SDR family NAD(P)-dependent oxidoreductase [Rhizobium calliandrae]|uniref:SDR family NAD(P)-dependent oxidoreductase n=1 Tax=Rhizobium calliandrae TaxID=1312182 RepID=UPI0032E50A1B
MPHGTVKDIPSQVRRIALVTGATSGIGYETAKALAGAGTKMIIASRNERNGAVVLAEIRAPTSPSSRAISPTSSPSPAPPRASAFRAADRPAHQLCRHHGHSGQARNGRRLRDADGGHFGHFALNMQQLPRVLAAANPRVVTVSSLAHRNGKINFDDLQWKKGYSSWRAYCQSKLATLMFSLEFDRIARVEDWSLMSTAAHPRFAVTGLQSTGPRP